MRGFDPEPRRSEWERITRRFLDSGAFAGALVRVEDASGLLFEAGLGDSRRDADGRKAILATDRFDLASVTKLFTATAVLRLVSLGRLALGDRIAEVLGWTRPDLVQALAGVDIAALLCHSSGIHYWYPFYARMGESFEDSLAEVLRTTPVRPEVVYSDLNFMLLGRVVEAASRMGLREAMADLVLGPLGLGHTAYSPVAPEGTVASEFGNRIEEGMVAALRLGFPGWRPRDRAICGEADDGNCHYYFGGASGHAGLFADARDLAALGRLWLAGGRIPCGPGAGQAFIEPSLAAEASRDQGGGRGLGFQLGENYPCGGYGHTGFSGSYLHINPGSVLVIAGHANRLHMAVPRRINDYWQELSAALLNPL